MTSSVHGEYRVGLQVIRVLGLVNPDPDAPTVGFAQSTYTVHEGGTVDVEVELSVAQDATVTVPVTPTARNGASAADYSGVPADVTFDPGVTTVGFTVTAIDDAADDDGENVLLELGTPPDGLRLGEIAATVVEIEDDDGPAPASGDVRLVGGPDRFEGRLEIFFRGRWGAACDDRFFEPSGEEENLAPDVACKLLGFRSGSEAQGYARPHVAVADEPIWLDDVRCLASVPAHRVNNPRSLFDCYYAGPGLHNCTHEEDVGLRCSNASEANPLLVPAAVATPLVVPSGSGGLSVLWQVPAGPVPTGYDVEYRTTGGEWQGWTHAGTLTTTTITGLEAATDYHVRVRGTNAEGAGDWSPEASGRTGVQGAAPPDAPSAPTLTAGETWIEASWTAPSDNGSAITDYDVGYRTTNGNWQNASHTGTDTVEADRRACRRTRPTRCACVRRTPKARATGRRRRRGAPTRRTRGR